MFEQRCFHLTAESLSGDAAANLRGHGLGGYHAKDHGTNKKHGKSGVSVLSSRYRIKRP